MKNFEQFILEFNDLPIGITNYEFNIKDWFFENYDYWEVNKGDVKVDLSLNKEERMYVLHFRFDGFVTLTCDRCGDDYEQPVKGEDEFIIKVGNENFGDEENITVLPEHVVSYDISQNIYENISLLIPMHHVHPADSKGNSKCNKEALKLLDKLSVKQHNDNENDPRWDELKKLKEKNKKQKK